MKQISFAVRLPLLFLVAVLVVGTGYIIWQQISANKPTSIETKYVSFGGGYLFSIPAKYIADGTAMPGVTVVYPEGSPAQNGQSLNDLYLNGTVAIQPLGELKNSNPEVFATYVKDVLAADLRKAFKGATDLRSAKQNGVEAFEVFALGEGGKSLRVLYAVNFTQPLLVVAQDYGDVFKTVGFTVEDLKKSSLISDLDQAAQATKEVAQKLQQQNGAQSRKNATTKFKQQVTEEQLVASLQESDKYLRWPVNIVGGSYDGNLFIAQLVFEAKTEGEQFASGVISLRKKGKTWKLDGLQLPK